MTFTQKTILLLLHKSMISIVFCENGWENHIICGCVEKKLSPSNDPWRVSVNHNSRQQELGQFSSYFTN